MNDRIGSAYKKTKLKKGRVAACDVFIIMAAVAKLAGKGGDDGHMPVKSESISLCFTRCGDSFIAGR